MTIGERIQQIRVANRMSQEEFGEILGTTRQSVSKWENDQTLPEIEKIVKIARLFSVTTDSLLLDGISTFADDNEPFRCRVYRSAHSEIVLTERFVLEFHEDRHENKIGCRLYVGNRTRKICTAAAEHDLASHVTNACGMSESGEKWFFGRDDRLVKFLGEAYDEAKTRSMRTAEKFSVLPNSDPLPTVSQIGIGGAIRQWSMGTEYRNDEKSLMLHLCTADSEYIFQIHPEVEDIYIGASWNFPFELGLFSGEQYFRIRDTMTHSENYCGFSANFSSSRKNVVIPTEYAKLGQCVSTPLGWMWCLKRYSEDEIVLEGCGGDEYVYSRKKEFAERYESR